MTEAAQHLAAAEEEPDLDFDVALGAADGVVAYSNLDDYYFSGEKNYQYGVYVGYKYQCVEYARRYLLNTQGVILRQCHRAAEIFDMTKIDNAETAEEHNYVACPNGKTKVKPAVGMTLIYPLDKKMPVGHVAIISAVGDGWAGIAEQNQESKCWKGGSYGRQVPLSQDEDGHWYLKETQPDLIDSCGWLYVEGVKFREPLPHNPSDDLVTERNQVIQVLHYPKLNIHEKFLATVGPKQLCRFRTKVHKPLPEQQEEDCLTVLQYQYEDLVHQYYLKNGGDPKTPGHVPVPHGTYWRRSLVPRSTMWHSVYVPSEELGISSISGAFRCYRLVEMAALAYYSSISADPAKLAAEAAAHGMPTELLGAAANQVCSKQEGVSCVLSALDYAFGTLGLYFDNDADSYRILHTELDSLNLLMDVNATQVHYKQQVGLDQGWQVTGFGNDAHRTIRNYLKFKRGVRNADSPLIFLDFGDKFAEMFGLPADLAHMHGVESLNGHYLGHYLKKFLIEKQADVDNGDLLEKDRPQWVVEICDFWDARVEIVGNRLIVDKKEVMFAWKMTSWAVLFAALQSKVADHSKLEKLRQLIYAVCTTDDSPVFQPLWTHVVSHPSFGYHISSYATAQSASPEQWNKYVIPPAAYELDAATGLYVCKQAVHAYSGLQKRVPASHATQPNAEHKTCSNFYFPGTHCLLVGGKRSAALHLEGRTVHKDNAGASCSTYDLVHPASLTYIWGLAMEEDEEEETEQQ